jgi:hypothetical protein
MLHMSVPIKKFRLVSAWETNRDFSFNGSGGYLLHIWPIWEEVCSRSIEGNLQILLPEPNFIRFRIQILHDVTNSKIFACPQNRRLYSKFYEPVLITIGIWLEFHLYVMVILVVPRIKADSSKLSYCTPLRKHLDEKHLPQK